MFAALGSSICPISPPPTLSDQDSGHKGKPHSALDPNLLVHISLLKN